MKTKYNCLFIGLALLVGVHQVAAQSARFFRVAGPVASTITAFSADGHITWTNAPTNATFTIQTAASLVNPSNWVDYVQVPTTGPATTLWLYAPPPSMALVPAGSFILGDTLDGEFDAVPTNVYVSAFYMDANLVSYSQWQSVYNWATSHGYGFEDAGLGKAANHPVQTVNWYDTVKWSNARSQQAGLTPVYYTDAGLTQVYMSGDVDAVYADWMAKGYRLPTETEWEKAARGGLSGKRFPWGNTIIESQANYCGDTSVRYDLGPNGYNAAFTNGLAPYTSPVGYFAPNGYGLFDMAGNVSEWCWDWFAPPPYPAGSPYLGGNDPRGPATGSLRVMRSCSWFNYPDYARCANRRESVVPFVAYSGAGFRCVRGL